MKLRSKAAAVTLCLCLFFFAVPVSAEEAYTYTVTFYAGNQGVFTGTEGLSVRHGKGTVTAAPDRITISGLEAGDVVSFDVQAGALDMGGASKYYAKGIRESGRDNSTVTASAFKVDGDADYVMAYGMKGNMVAYHVNYQDEDGSRLSDSRTYYGNVGDKMVAAYLYIEGYTPQALSIAKTLSENEAENVITFVYVKDTADDTQASGGSGTQPGTAGGNQTAGTPGNETADGGTGNAADEAGNDGAAVADEAEGGAQDAEAEQPEADDTDTLNLPDGNVPLDQELLDLDDEEVPTSNTKLDQKKIEKGLPFALRIGIALAAAAALADLWFILWRRRKAERADNRIKEKKESGQ
ncbi:hypothetical protein IMSAGC012_02284 [Lachnospiraceae bacterium]|jgi:hypothetical protein|nr:hypothetical protein IMSAGC012_02284 [Lachnospiraceae bacterium]